ncbi:MAG: PAS domain S-box protein [Candidatus Schekmanbacteria bacterium]|nr:PAS domain S-box protein [Candidatus Schekmanbacteria bacterium]
MRFLSGEVGKYLEHRSGPIDDDLVSLSRVALRPLLRAAIDEAQRLGREVMARDLTVQVSGQTQRFDLVVTPFSEPDSAQTLWAVVFRETGRAVEPTPVLADIGNVAELSTMRLLESELATALTRLKAATVALEAHAKSAREVQGENARLIKETQTLTAYRARLDTLLDAANIPIVWVDAEMHIAFFTPAADAVIHVSAHDCGRPLADLACRVRGVDLPNETRAVLQTGASRELQVRRLGADCAPRVYLLRIHAHRKLDTAIDGAVLTFVDISERERIVAELRMREERQTAVAQLGLKALAAPHLDGIFSQALSQVKDMLQADHVEVLEWQRPDGYLAVRSSFGWDRAGQKEAVGAGDASRTLAAVTLAADGPVISPAYLSDSRFHPSPGLAALGARSAMACAIQDHDGPFGLLCAFASSPRTFRTDDAIFVQSVANMLALVIQQHNSSGSLAIECAGAQAIMEAGSFEQAARDTLRALVQTLGVAAGAWWAPRQEQREEPLCCEHVVIPAHPASERDLLRAMAAETWQTSMESVVGTAMRQGAVTCAVVGPHWHENPLLLELSAHLVIRSSTAIAIRDRDETIGVLELLAEDEIPFERALLRTLERIGRNLGEYARAARAEQRLRERERSFRALAESIPHLVWTADATGRMDYFNHQALVYFGRSLGEMTAPGAWLELIHPDDRPVAHEAWSHAVQSGAELRIDCRFRRARDDAYLWHTTRAVPLTDQENRPFRWFGTSTEVQAQKVTEAALAQLATIVEQSDDAILSVDLDGTILTWNPGATSLFGFSADEVAGRSAEIALSHEYRGQFLENLARIRRGERIDAFEATCRRKDGRMLVISVRLSPIKDPNGREIAVSAVVRDISEKKQDERLLVESEQRLRRVLVSLPVPMVVYDRQGDILEMSYAWAAITGHTAPELRTIDCWINAVSRGRADEIRNCIFGIWTADNASETSEHVIRGPLGEPLTLLFATSRLGHLSDGREIAIAAAVDITGIRKAEKQLAEMNRQKDQFLATLGHELRNPLAAIRTATELLMTGDADGDSFAEPLRVLDRQSAHMAKLIDGLLDVARVARGKIQLSKQLLDLTPLVRNVVEDRSRSAGDRGQEIRLEAPAAPVWVLGDACRLVQIADNLVSNAVKFSAGHGAIAVRLTADAHTASLTVRDQGPGIESALLPRIFEPFLQAEKTMDRSASGLGLGLALVKGLVELHGGSVTASSAGAGLGAEFLVSLPIAQAAPAAEVSIEMPRHRCRVLVVEDNADTLVLTRMVLVRAGHEVETACTGVEALPIARRFRPDVVLCDIGLPGDLDGFAVARAIRTDPELAHTRLVALSGYGRAEDKVRARDAGFDAHLTKPVGVKQIRTVVASSRKQRS